MTVFIISEIQSGITGLLLFTSFMFTDYNEPLLIRYFLIIFTITLIDRTLFSMSPNMIMERSDFRVIFFMSLNWDTRHSKLQETLPRRSGKGE